MKEKFNERNIVFFILIRDFCQPHRARITVDHTKVITYWCIYLTPITFQELVNGDLIHLPHFFAVPFVNGVLHILGRMTLPRSEYQALWTLARGALLFQRNSNDLGAAITITPWLKDLMPKYSGYKDLRDGNQVLLDFFTVRWEYYECN